MVKSLPDFEIEKKLWKKHQFVCGCDEVGRGAFAGPVVAGAVVFSKPIKINNLQEVIINDSKKLTIHKRKIASDWIMENCLTYAVGASTVSEINRLGIVKGTNMALRRAVKLANSKLEKNIEFLLLDAFYLPYIKNYPRNKRKGGKGLLNSASRQFAIVRGDTKSISIASASIIAKVYRDELMEKLSKNKDYFIYNWEKNRGYGTKEHTNAILSHGITKLHRRQFVESYLSKV